MRRLRSSRIGVAQGTVALFEHFHDGGPMWEGEGPRVIRRHVSFETAFREAPAVHAGLVMWDTDGLRNQRADLSIEAIGVDGFDLVFRTWGDSRVARARAAWIAIGDLTDDEDWDV